MAHANDNSRESKHPCIYWSGTECTATEFFDEASITCYHEGNCNGFGTCRGCTHYDQGGLKFGSQDGKGGNTQTPMNLKLYNIRAKVKPCCNWDGDPIEFEIKTIPSNSIFVTGGLYGDITEEIDGVETTTKAISEVDTDGFPSSGRLFATLEGSISFYITYTGTTATSFTGVTGVPPVAAGNLSPYQLSLEVQASTPRLVPTTETADPVFGEEKSLCIIEAAAPWQEGFTDENPSPYGCNGAKAECPYYTGPKFTELVDEKMDTGNRITAKQILELRFYSAKWALFDSPRAEYEKRFQSPDIWAWVMSNVPTEEESLPGTGAFDVYGKPLIQRVSIKNLGADTPEYIIGPPVHGTTGTPTIGGPPSFPDFIKDLDDSVVGMEVIFPKDTSASEPFVRKTFTQAEMVMWVSVQVNSDNEVVAINTTKHPQDGVADVDFVTYVKQNYPNDAVGPQVTGLPGLTFPMPLVLNGERQTDNHIKIFLDTGATDGSMLTQTIFVRHVFYHAEIAQTLFRDRYGHPQFDPWIDRFTEIEVEAKFLHLTNNTQVHDVYWNTIVTGGQKTLYAIEKTKVERSEGDDSLVTWKALSCNSVMVTYEDPLVNRVYPWQAWETSSKGELLYAKMDRTGNDSLPEGEPTEVDLTLAFASTQGNAIPANVAVFTTPEGIRVVPFDPDAGDILETKYAYTEYKQGPILSADEDFLKFPSDLSDAVIDALVYDIDFNDAEMEVSGTYLKFQEGEGQTTTRLSSCEQLLGNCYTEKALENEQLSITTFHAGGVGDAGIKTVTDMHNECLDDFDAQFKGLLFEDGVEVSFNLAGARLGSLYLKEGDLRYDVIFKDEEGRPVGKKSVGFLAQSALAQTRDVEIKYKWGSHMQHYPTRPQMLVHAYFWEPTFATDERLREGLYENEPSCGDHTESTTGLTLFTGYDPTVDEFGAMWYPYKQCRTPRYHVGGREWYGPYHYTNTVEGFDSLKRRNYWERMRWWDQYRPSIMNEWGQIGCFFSEYTTTANSYELGQFTGYTKIRSDHSFGPNATDRESLRLSRHWQKRNLEATVETITQEENGLTVELSEEFSALLYDDEGNLKDGTETATPVWVHMGDGFSVVNIASEKVSHPFSRYILDNVGDYTFAEIFHDERVELRDTFEDRDHTSNVVRFTNGEKPHVPEEDTATNAEGELEDKSGREIKWVFKERKDAWAWLPPVPEPVREESSRVTGLHLSNPTVSFLKKSKQSATHSAEGNHGLFYSAHQFTASGTIDKSAQLSLDGGPVWNISQTDGLLYITEDSPYNPALHEGEEYEFRLFGHGPGGIGLLADNTGLQYFEIDGEKKATYAGINISLGYDLNELPHDVVEVAKVERLWVGDAEDVVGFEKQVKDFTVEYEADDLGVKTLSLDFRGHYFVESVHVTFKLGSLVDDVFDIPTAAVSGLVKEDGIATKDGTEASPETPSRSTFGFQNYSKASDGLPIEVKRDFLIKSRLFTLDIELGARLTGKRMTVTNVEVFVRDHKDRTESVVLYEPRLQKSSAETGTHRPSDLEFYFQRTNPDFSKSFDDGYISLASLSNDRADYSVAAIPKTEAKYTGRQIKDLIPMYNFTGFSAVFPYDNIDISAIEGYVEGTSPAAQTLRYIDSPVRTSSKGWTMATSRHYSDPSASSVSTDTGPGGLDNVYTEGLPKEDLQGALYDEARRLLEGSSIYRSFWHPAEKEFFRTNVGVNLDEFSWTLELHSTVAPINRVYRDFNFGCYPQTTNENTDGNVHTISTWQAKGVFHYLCDARWSWACLAVVMNKCNTVLFEDYGTTTYLDNNVVDRFTYKFEFPPKDSMSYIKGGLINQNEEGGFIGGTGGVGVAQAAAPFPPLAQVQEKYQTETYVTGENKYQ